MAADVLKSDLDKLRRVREYTFAYVRSFKKKKKKIKLYTNQALARKNSAKKQEGFFGRNGN